MSRTYSQIKERYPNVRSNENEEEGGEEKGEMALLP